MAHEERAERVVVHEQSSAGRAISKLSQIVWFIVGLIVTLLFVRVMLALIGANLDNEFASLIYSWSDPFVSPFRGLLQIGQFEAGVARFEIETLVAAIVYLLVGTIIVRAIELARP